MPRLIISRDQIRAGVVNLEGDTAHHLAGSLRARVGERIIVVDDGGEAHGVRLEAVHRQRVTGTVEWSRPAAGEPRLQVEVIQGLVREFDEVVAGLSQVGAVVIRPVITARAVTRPDASRAADRLRRWRRISREAAELAHRATVPEVAPLADLASAIAELAGGTRIVACALDAGTPLCRLDAGGDNRIAVVIGPEGGLDPAEVEQLLDLGAETAHLGPRVLPARNAAAMAVSLLLARSGDLDAGAASPP